MIERCDFSIILYTNYQIIKVYKYVTIYSKYKSTDIYTNINILSVQVIIKNCLQIICSWNDN